LQGGADLLNATLAGDVEKVKLCLKKGEDIDCRDEVGVH
jgi:hypothetical protein